MNPNRSNVALKVGLFSQLNRETALDLAAMRNRAGERERRAFGVARQRRTDPDPLINALAEAAVFGWDLNS